MEKSNFDKYLKEQLKDPVFETRFNQAGKEWDTALQICTSYCSHCKTITNLNTSTTMTLVPEKAGKMKLVTSKTSHCASCAAIVYSENEERFRN